MAMRTIGVTGRGWPSRFPAAPKRARPTLGSAAAGLLVVPWPVPDVVVDVVPRPDAAVPECL